MVQDVNKLCLISLDIETSCQKKSVWHKVRLNIVAKSLPTYTHIRKRHCTNMVVFEILLRVLGKNCFPFVDKVCVAKDANQVLNYILSSIFIRPYPIG